MKKLIIAFILGGIVFGSIGIYATTLYKATDIFYEPSDASWEVSNVNDALNNLYSDLTELENIKKLGDATAEDILEGKTAVVQGKLVTGTKEDSISILETGVWDYGRLGYEQTSPTQVVTFSNEYTSEDNVYLVVYSITETNGGNIFARGSGLVEGSEGWLQLTNVGNIHGFDISVKWALVKISE